jgi:hypothetical protein
MGCFCHQTLAPLRLALPQLNLSLEASLPSANVALSLAGWLGARALPAAPWQPDPNWLALVLPSLRLNASAMATISALAQLRAQVLAQFGIDLLLPGQAAAFARIVATLNLRLSAIAHIGLNPLAWLRLAALNGAIDQVNLALQAGLFAPSESLSLALTMPAGLPMPSWRAFLAALAGLAPLLAAAAQLNVNLSAHFTAQLSASLRPLLSIALPQIGAANLSLMASLTAALSAVAGLNASLGISALSLGFPAVQAMVSLRLTAMLSALSASLRLNLSSPNLLAELLALLPTLPYCPSSLATHAVVQAALSINAEAMAALNWQVPALGTLPVLRIGLPSCAFAAQLQAALGINAVLPAPCGSGCDAAATMRALAAA